MKFVPDRMLTVSVPSPVVLNEEGLPLQVTVCPEDGGLGVHLSGRRSRIEEEAREEDRDGDSDCRRSNTC